MAEFPSVPQALFTLSLAKNAPVKMVVTVECNGEVYRKGVIIDAQELINHDITSTMDPARPYDTLMRDVAISLSYKAGYFTDDSHNAGTTTTP